MFLSLGLAAIAGCGDFEWLPDTNVAPIANAGAAQSVLVGSVVALDGSASGDANGNALTYKWSLTSKPTGSSALLSNTTAIKPTFTADVEGAYVVSLTVNDGKTDSTAATVTVTASNAPPVANAGSAQTGIITGATVTLDGSTSHAVNGGTLTYNWSFTSFPTPNAPILLLTDPVKPTFKPSLAGTYEISLVVYEGKTPSPPATVTVTVINNAGSLTVTW